MAVTGRGRELIVVELLKTYNIERVYKKEKHIQLCNAKVCCDFDRELRLKENWVYWQ